MSGQIRCGQSAWRKRWIISGLFFLTISVYNSIGSLLTKKTCGSTNPNNNFIDLSEPKYPGPFYDLTTFELKQLREYLERDPNIRAVDPTVANVSNSIVFAADLFVAKKSDILNYLDHGGPQPDRKARVVMIRGDKYPPVVEEYVCGPLPYIQSCDLLQLASRRNPVEFTFRPVSEMEYETVHKFILPEVDRRVGFILQESYGSTFTMCEPRDCLSFEPMPVGSGLTKDAHTRLMWYFAQYDIPFPSSNNLDFSVLVDCAGSDPTKWSVVMIWYSNRIFQNYDELIELYRSDRITKTRVNKPVNDANLITSSQRRGEPLPPNPQRPPTLVEPDGKRYTVKNRQVQYMGWTFKFRSSSFTGPAVYDVWFKRERIAFEISLQELSVFYNAFSPGQTANFVESSNENIGRTSRSLIPGTDCPDTATFIPNVFMSLIQREPEVESAGFCIFENNDGNPLRRHLSLFTDTFYGGMLNSALVCRSVLAIWNYDYIVDFIFYQNGVVGVHIKSTGYMETVYYTEQERPYGFRLHDYILANIHSHYAIFKVDMDIGGTCNRYETLDIHKEKVNLTAFPDIQYTQVRFTPNLKRTEQEALFRYDFNKPRYHVVHNEAKKTNFDQLKGYRILIHGMTKSLLEDNEDNEPTVSWQRYQMFTTRHHDDEISASSIYGIYDGLNPVVNFTSYYSNNENIVDEDLVFWPVTGMYHIPRTEDLPVTTTVGENLGFYLLPYNYFPECPSMGSRDAIYIEPKDPNNPGLGVKVERYGNSRDQCVIPKQTLEEDLEADPERFY